MDLPTTTLAASLFVYLVAKERESVCARVRMCLYVVAFPEPSTRSDGEFVYRGVPYGAN